jgi:hypothetical protein
MTHPFLKTVYRMKSNPSTSLYHGSVVSGISQFDLSEKRSEKLFLAEGEGIYLISDFDVAKSYGPYLYEVKIHGPIFDATKFENLKKILLLIKRETGIDLTNHKMILDTLQLMVDGRYSILREDNGLIWQIKLILESDERFTDPDEIKKVVNVVETAINEVKAMKYFDPKISKSPLYIVRDPKMIEIVREIKSNPSRKYHITQEQFEDTYNKHNGNYSKIALELTGQENSSSIRHDLKSKDWFSFEKYPAKGQIKKKPNPITKIGDTEIITSIDGTKQFHLKKINKVWLVSWEPHQYNAKRFAKRKDALDFINQKIKKNPLYSGSSRKIISKNISRLMHEGYPQNQAVAIVLNKAGVSKSNPSKLRQIAPDHYEGVVAGQPIVIALDNENECWIIRCGEKGKKYMHEIAYSLNEAKKMVENWLRLNTRLVT